MACPSLFTSLAMGPLYADLPDMLPVQARVLLAIAGIVCATAMRCGARAQRPDEVRPGTQRALQSQQGLYLY